MTAARLIADTPLDLMHLGSPSVIGAWLIETPDGLALHDPGPASTIDALTRALAEHDVELADIRHLILSHIHLDHAGAAGLIARDNPDVTVHVSHRGARHLAHPERLEASSRRVFGEAYDELWGGMTPVPESQILPIEDDDERLGMRVFAAPGHAMHHVAWLMDDGTLLAGDACGVRIMPHDAIYPVAPPPDCDIAGWHSTVQAIRGLAPNRLALTHFGMVDADVSGHLIRLEHAMDDWLARIAGGLDEQQFADSVRDDLARSNDLDAQPAYDQTAPPWMSWHGMRRYLATSGQSE